jgi:hypothetical protein
MPEPLDPPHDPVLVDVDPPLAGAAVDVLVGRGLQARTDPGSTGSTLSVSVPEEERDAALAALAAELEQIRALADERAAAAADSTFGVWTEDPDDPRAGPPLVMERFLSMRVLVVVLLAPLLAATLARPGVPLGLVLGVLVAGAVLVLALRDRWR